jgi:DNA polymerase-3 subunit alpha
MKLVSIAHLDGMYYKPRIDKELLAQHLRGTDRPERLPQVGGRHPPLAADDYKGARELAGKYRTSSGQRICFLEMH